MYRGAGVLCWILIGDWPFCQMLSCIQLNPFLPSLATAVLACWLKAATRQLQKIDSLNLKGYNLSCRAYNVFKFGKQMKNWMAIFQVCRFWVLGGWLSINHVTLFEHFFLGRMDTRHHVVSHFLTCTQFVCWNMIARTIRVFVRAWFLRAVAAVIIIAKYIQTFENNFFFP